RCTRCSRPTAPCCRPPIRPSTSPSRSTARPSAWSWTPTTCGGTRTWPERSSGPPPRTGCCATRCATGTCHWPPSRCSPAATWAMASSTSPPSRRWSPRAATTATSRWRSSTRTSGPPPPTRPSASSRSATSSWCCPTPEVRAHREPRPGPASPRVVMCAGEPPLALQRTQPGGGASGQRPTGSSGGDHGEDEEDAGERRTQVSAVLREGWGLEVDPGDPHGVGPEASSRATLPPELSRAFDGARSATALPAELSEQMRAALLAPALAAADEPLPFPLLRQYTRYWRDGVRTDYENDVRRLGIMTGEAVLA